MKHTLVGLACWITILTATSAWAGGLAGYYRFPAIRNDTIVFTAEGDLWKVAIAGGVAQRLTTHPGLESHIEMAPDGSQVASLSERTTWNRAFRLLVTRPSSRQR